MTTTEVLERLYRSYSVYYDLTREGVTEPFAAEAAFHAHDEQYFFTKGAKMDEMDSFEYVFFHESEHMTLAEAQRLEELAWNTGMARVKSGPKHRSTDVGLILIADKIDEEAFRFVKKLRRYKSYKFTLHGWSHFRVVALETSSGRLAFNRMGQNLKKLFRNIISS